MVGSSVSPRSKCYAKASWPNHSSDPARTIVFDALRKTADRTDFAGILRPEALSGVARGDTSSR